jgi:hypothetical protein
MKIEKIGECFSEVETMSAGEALPWTVESMHWLPDARFGEDFCRTEDRNARQNLNIVRKTALNTIKVYKTKTASKHPVSKVMPDCLLEPENIRSVLKINEN